MFFCSSNFGNVSVREFSFPFFLSFEAFLSRTNESLRDFMQTSMLAETRISDNVDAKVERFFESFTTVHAKAKYDKNVILTLAAFALTKQQFFFIINRTK